LDEGSNRNLERSTPRTQDILLEQDRKAVREVRRVQNEAADERKAIKAEREAAEKARQQYEAQLPALMQELQNAQQNAFSDIRTVDDVTKLANEDPFRYLQWQAHQTKLQAVNAENERAKGQQAQKQQSEWAEHVNKENALAAELIPDLADKDKGPALMKRAAERLSELGFKNGRTERSRSRQAKAFHLRPSLSATRRGLLEARRNPERHQANSSRQASSSRPAARYVAPRQFRRQRANPNPHQTTRKRQRRPRHQNKRANPRTPTIRWPERLNYYDSRNFRLHHVLCHRQP
jgi:hypothetical protein